MHEVPGGGNGDEQPESNDDDSGRPTERCVDGELLAGKAVVEVGGALRVIGIVQSASSWSQSGGRPHPPHFCGWTLPDAV